jgi:predicted nucleotidyltransferase
LNSVTFKSVDHEAIKRAVNSFAHQLRQDHPEVERVIWFGSWVTGLPVPGSDVDICLIISSSENSPRDRISKYLPLGFPVGVDLFAYTRSEFEQLRNNTPGLYEAISSGVEV